MRVRLVPNILVPFFLLMIPVLSCLGRSEESSPPPATGDVTPPAIATVDQSDTCRTNRSGDDGISEVMVDNIRISGSQAFRDCTTAALVALKQNRAFSQVKQYLAMIREAPQSGMRADAPLPTFDVGAPTWKHSTVWYAGSIVHDGHHSELYHLQRPWTGTGAERECLVLQKEALKDLNADPSYLTYIDGFIENPTYHLTDPDNRNWGVRPTLWLPEVQK